ncbi:MAG: hypothetical protein JNK82_27840 [Myxococcaceae bacterium]|nr:hypothetical protein [Myxococcaceae bacterium]
MMLALLLAVLSPAPAIGDDLPPPPPPPLVAAVVEEPEPVFEWQRATAETAVGTLAAAGLTLLPYQLALKPMAEGSALFGSDAASTAVFVTTFALVPLAVAAIEVAIANGSRWYSIGAWLPALAALAAEGLVLSAYFATRNGATIGTEGASNGGDGVLLAGTVGVVPAVTAVLINFMKTKR